MFVEMNFVVFFSRYVPWETEGLVERSSFS